MRTLLVFALSTPLCAQQFLARDLGSNVGPRPYRVHVFDVDRDRDVDLFVSYFDGTPDQLLLHDGYGGFTALPQLPSGADLTSDVACEDVDRDGRPDLLLAKGRSPRLYLQTAAGFADVTATHVPVRDVFPRAVAVADVERDGDLDWLVGAYTGNSSAPLLRNDGSGRFAVDAAFPTVPLVRVARTSDIDLDGDPDFAVVSQSTFDRLMFLVNDGAGRFVTRLFVSPHEPENFDLGDVDGDGDPDAIIAHRSLLGGHLQVARNDGHGNFQYVSPPLPSVFQSYYDVAIADLDGDGDGDIVVAGFENDAHQTTFYRNTGNGQFIADALRDVGSRDPAVADLDGDEDPDVVALRTFAPARTLLNLHRHLDAQGPPRIGQAWALDLYDRPSYAQGFGLAVPFGGQVAGRLSVPPFGTLLVDPLTLVALPPVYLAPGQPTRTIVPLPSFPYLVGSDAFAQAVIVLPLGGTHLTNAVHAVITN